MLKRRSIAEGAVKWLRVEGDRNVSQLTAELSGDRCSQFITENHRLRSL